MQHDSLPQDGPFGLWSVYIQSGTVCPMPKTPLRAFRIADDLYNKAKAKAAERGESLSDVIRQALERYVKR